eukprot:Seg1056.2 transcript_id=Seg1056.2/GoldUCD/mRNA.D3Y31 product="hypothetical protein" protein_id=Seg1056.2/GoldUCD/D3Y31
MCSVDPMHDIMLGLVKKEMSILLDSDGNENSLDDKQKASLKNRLRGMELPTDCGRLPYTILDKTGLDGFTAQQWQIFAIVFARPCFYGLLTDKAFQCLRLLCEIVELCSKNRITEQDIHSLKLKLMKHHILFKSLYGKWHVTVNQHMALHLPETISKFGPCHGYWCFGSERLNGTLGALPSSGRSIEKETFNRFVLQQTITIGSATNVLSEHMMENMQELCPSLVKMLTSEEDDDAEGHDKQIARLHAEEFLSARGNALDEAFDRQRNVEIQEAEFAFLNASLLPPERSNKIMDDKLYGETTAHLQMLFGNRLLYISRQFSKYARCNSNGITFSSSMNRSERSCYAKVFCAMEQGELPQPYFCKILFFFKLNLIVKSEEASTELRQELPFAYVNWYKPIRGRSKLEKDTGLHQIRKDHYAEHIVGVNRLVQRVVLQDIGNSFVVAPLLC